MFRRVIWIAVLAAGAVWPQAQRDLRLERESKRVALLVGNDAYPKAPLRNPSRDSASLSAVLKTFGFDVDVTSNTDLRGMARAVDRFIARIEPGDIALFFYAGHGLQLNGENYLVPVDFDAKDEADAPYVTYSVSRVHDRMVQARSRLNILILDACRNNPFRTVRSGMGGWAAMNAGRGSLIAYATEPGQTADDNPQGHNGLFTTHLIEVLRQPGLKLPEVFDQVRERVFTASQHKQLPWIMSSVMGDFYFAVKEPATILEPPPAAPPAAQPDTALQIELSYWNSIKDSPNAELLEAYLRRYPKGNFVEIARTRLASIRPPAPPPKPVEAPPPSKPPAIRQFAAEPRSIERGRPTTLRWSVNGATEARIEPGLGVFQTSGYHLVSPNSTTQYTLTAKGPGGEATAIVTVTVVEPPPPSKPPAIRQFAVEPTSIERGRPATLRWSVSDATEARIDPGLGTFQASGSRPVSPNSTTQYTLTAKGPGGETTAMVTVTVVEPPPPSKPPAIRQFAIEPASIERGRAATLRWSVSDATEGGRRPCAGR
ncbi:MAG: caspase family protein [Acidobacteria bacterium]|nr:caspase family protein [Acidobacteriota bacterium]